MKNISSNCYKTWKTFPKSIKNRDSKRLGDEIEDGEIILEQGTSAIAGENVIPETRTIIIGQEVTASLAQNVYTATLQLLHESFDPIIYVINTQGGAILEGAFPILETMRVARSQTDVYTYCLGCAYSAGALLLAGGDLGCRYIAPTGSVLVHDIQLMFNNYQVDFSKDMPLEMREARIVSERYRDAFVYEIGKRAVKGEYKHPTQREEKKLIKKLNELFSLDYQVLTPKEAIEIGIADEEGIFIPYSAQMAQRAAEEDDDEITFEEDNDDGCGEEDCGE